VIIIDAFEFATPRTKDFLAAVGTLGLVENSKRAKTLVIDSLDNANLILSSRNVEKTKVTNSFGLNIYDIIYHEKLLISKAAVEELNQLLDPAREGSKADEAEDQAQAPVEAPKAKKEAKPKAAKSEGEAPAKKEAKPKAAKKEKAPAVEETTQEATDNE
jgi:flagellar biosynthesis GTPase FlhF